MVDFEFKDEQPVLVRDTDDNYWMLAAYKECLEIGAKHIYRVYGIYEGGIDFYQCIPYKGNEYLLGTTDSPDKEGE